MAVNTDFVTEELMNSNFEIIEMLPDQESGDIDFRIKHDIHPEIEVVIKLITRKDDEDVMEMMFEGPDEYTDEEAKQVLQDVMDFLVSTIEKAVTEQPDTIDQTTTSPSTLNEEELDGNN